MAFDRTAAQGFLYTDLYQLTMAQLYFEEGLHEQEAAFEYFYRRNPDYGQHQAGYTIFAGLERLLDRIEETTVTDADVEYLAGLRGSSGQPLFRRPFLGWLQDQGPIYRELEVRALLEGRVAHPNTPLVTVRGPLAKAQLIETALLNDLNYPTLIAAKAARLREAAGEARVVDFGMRRGQSSGVTAGSRAALIGGVDASSYMGVSASTGVQPAGTHAHSMVQAFIANGGGELAAFRAYARYYPDDCVLLVDTIDTLGSGLPNAITVFRELIDRGHRPLGIRLDSGDLAHLSVECAIELDRAGLTDVGITLSNQLDELTIWQIRAQIEQEARARGIDPQGVLARLNYGVGTRLMVSSGAPALDGVYKLVAVRSNGDWQPAIKVSDSPTKTINPGVKTLYRVYDERGMATADLVALEGQNPDASAPLTLCHHSKPDVGRTLQPEQVSGLEPLHESVWANAQRQLPRESMELLRERRRRDQERLDLGVRRLINPHVYHVSITPAIAQLKARLIEERNEVALPGAP